MGYQQPAVDTHPQREKIIEALVAGESPQSISKWCNPPINHVSIWRYRRNRIEAKLSQVQQTAKALQDNIIQATRDNGVVDPAVIHAATSALTTADPIMSRVLAKYSRYDDMLAKAQETGDLGGFAAVDRAETQALTLHANLTGRLQSAAPTTLVQIVIGQDTRETPVNRPDDAPGETIEIAATRE
jgi:hypothetical protein